MAIVITVEKESQLRDLARQLYLKYVASVAAVVRNQMLGSVSADGVDEIVQQVFLDFWILLRNGKLDWLNPQDWEKDEAHLRAILFRMSRFERIRAYRTRSRWKSNRDDRDIPVEDEQLERDRLLDLEDAMRLISSNQRTVVVLRRQGFSLKEIAMQLGVKPATVRTRYMRATRRLKALLGR